MRWGLLGVRVGIILVNLAIVAIIVLSVLPLASGGLRIHLPQEELAKPSYENNVAKFTIPMDIYNGGYFDITDFSVHFRVSDGDYLIADHASDPVTIVKGRTTQVNIDMELDLSTVPTTELKRLVFESTRLNVEVGMAAGYSMGLIKADCAHQPIHGLEAADQRFHGGHRRDPDPDQRDEHRRPGALHIQRL